MAKGAAALSYPVRLPVLGVFLSLLGATLAVLTLPAAGVAFYHRELGVALAYTLVAAALLGTAWAARKLPRPSTIQSNEGIVIVGLTFVLTPVFMAIPFAVGGLSPVDALFEAVSAVTTTGLSTLGSVDGASSAFLFERAWLQWCGGLGIAVLSVALLRGHHAASRRLTHPTTDTNLATTARTQARQILRVYVILTLAGTLLLSFVVDDVFAALVNMLSTLSTGGFSPYEASIAGLPRSGAWIVTVFSLLGAVPLLLYHQLINRQPRAFTSDPELRTLLVLTLIASGLLGLSLWWNMGLDPVRAIEDGAMLGVSAQTTTGFSITDVARLDPTSKLLLLLSMFIGGGSGSTAGGIKLLRFLIILRLLQYFLHRAAMPPHGVAHPRMSGQTLDRTEIEQAILVAALFATAIGLSWVVFVAAGFEPLDALFEVSSAVGTVGLSTGITAPDLAWPLKILLCMDMIFGRLEALALLVILYPTTWIGKRAG